MEEETMMMNLVTQRRPHVGLVVEEGGVGEGVDPLGQEGGVMEVGQEGVMEVMLIPWKKLVDMLVDMMMDIMHHLCKDMVSSI
jgi:hypothetical protein